MVNSSKEGLLSHYKRWLRIKLSLDGFVFLKANFDIPICSPDPTFKCLSLTKIAKIASTTRVFINRT